jgi:SAM-dependent methyltransferase
VLELEVWAFARANLPSPPARVLEVGAGSGELARALAATGYDVLAIDPEPSGDNVRGVALNDLDEQPGSFDAAIAVVSLHHVEPLEESCLRLADLIRPGGTLLVDEFDVGAFDEGPADWLLEQWRRLGQSHERTSAELVAEHRAHLHPVERIVRALLPRFDVGPPVRGSYLYRWDLPESQRAAEELLIAQGCLPAVGARLVARRRG